MSLRFGITALEFRDVAGRVIVDGVPDFTRLDVADVVRDAMSDKYSVIEITMDTKHIVPGSIKPESIDKLVKIKEELGHSYTAHLPFWSIELATFNEQVRMGSVDSIIEAIELAKPLEPEAYVLHASGDLAAGFSRMKYNPRLMQLVCTFLAGFTAASVEDIVSRTEINPRELAIENVDFPFTILREVVDDLDAGICFDTAHLLAEMSGTESVMEFYETHKDRIIEIHLQDAAKDDDETAVQEDHVALGRGKMGDEVLRDFFLELIKDKFDGPIIFELTMDEARESLGHIKKVVPEALD
ncbi:MAG: cobamide remodeling phosphodiesterase CbiR [Candidatus Thorarchaeota archaeon]|jgi:sugar phosphate isomerase/epimerase